MSTGRELVLSDLQFVEGLPGNAGRKAGRADGGRESGMMSP